MRARDFCAALVLLGGLFVSGGALAGPWAAPEYVAAGVPDLERPWTTTELRTAVDAITRAVAGHPERLPRYRDPRSGAVFSKLLAPLRTGRSPSVDSQVIEHFERYRALVDASALYQAVALRSMPREWLELSGAVLHEAAELERLSGAFIAAVGPRDDRLPERRAMVAKLRDGTGTMLVVQLVVAIDERVAPSERLAAIRNLTEVAPTLIPTVAPRISRALRKDVGTLAGATRGSLHEAVLRLQRAIGP